MTPRCTLALAGDTMLGRGVAEELPRTGPKPLFDSGVRAAVADADAFVLNLECCVSARGEPIPIPGKPFHFRAPPVAAEALADLGVRAVTLANNHALDYGPEALLDTLSHLADAGIETVGAGADLDQARAPVLLSAGGLRIGLLGVTDHPPEYAAGPGKPGVAFADLGQGVPDWLTEQIRDLREHTDIVLVTVHWGPNIVGEPVDHVRRAAPALLDAGATLIAGHSAHVFHGYTRHVLYDLGDFIDDYAIHPALRNDRSLLWLVALDENGPRRTEAVPLSLDYCRTRLTDPDTPDWDWTARRLIDVCARLGTDVEQRDGRVATDWTR
ncbi:CapA family protein [Streptomyces litchfieldiae]|uniref:CapA family protein n=1 Tax=Streptomyces litchfieldiae TaxID=3075543 RepID=A0ABU2MU85_9ACTN|nr:CapA family protein [Streptomyces sp. DSM 44938]MDT0345201.1 CapA family protein [Streptomyces sp. DSM 44938]